MTKPPEQENRRPRVLLITDVTLPGGVYTHLSQLALVGQRQGWDVTVLMDNGGGSDSVAHSFRRLGLSVERGLLARKAHSQRTIRETVWAAFERNQPDVVHVHCGSPRSALIPRELAISASLPLIFTEHYVAADLEISDDMLIRLRQLYPSASAIISVCEENRNLLREKFGLYSNKHTVICNSTNLPLAVCRKGDTPLKFSAITVARLTHQKGIDILLQAIATLPNDIRSQFQFTIAGDGEDESQLIQLAHNLCLTQCVYFIGWSYDVPTLLRAHDLFILPSRAEGQPIALLEALAVGLPCIASAVSGIPEVLGHGDYGILVNPNEPASLHDAIISFANTPSVFRQKSLAARAHLRANFDLERNMGEVVRLWQSVLM